MANPIGAYCSILFKDDGQTVDGYYVSFGTYRDDDFNDNSPIFDNFGVSDDRIGVLVCLPKLRAAVRATVELNGVTEFVRATLS